MPRRISLLGRCIRCPYSFGCVLVWWNFSAIGKFVTSETAIFITKLKSYYGLIFTSLTPELQMVTELFLSISTAIGPAVWRTLISRLRPSSCIGKYRKRPIVNVGYGRDISLMSCQSASFLISRPQNWAIIRLLPVYKSFSPAKIPLFYRSTAPSVDRLSALDFILVSLY